MFNPSLLERIIHKIKMKMMPFQASFRRRKLKSTTFTIISNNCWGGICYEYFGLPKQSPTVGTFFFADDYLKFISNLKFYLNENIKFICANESKHYDVIMKKNIICPIGVLDDVEVFFLHYADEAIAKEKWNRRIKRIDWDNLIFKFSKMNECTDNHLDFFEKLELPGKKFMFVNRKNAPYKHAIYYPGYDSDSQIDNDTFFWNRYIDVVKMINS